MGALVSILSHRVATTPAELDRNRLLDALPLDELIRIRPHLRKVKLGRGETLYNTKSPITRIYFPTSGMVSLVVAMETGEMIETAVVGCDGVVGGSVANQNHRSFAHATVQFPGEAMAISSQSFLNLCSETPQLKTFVRKYQEFILVQAQQTAACHALHSIRARAARWILQSQDLLGTPSFEMTQDFLSHMLGVRRTSVSVVAHGLREEGILEYSRGHLRILDANCLSSMPVNAIRRSGTRPSSCIRNCVTSSMSHSPEAVGNCRPSCTGSSSGVPFRSTRV
jgi:CRP-like cAMP-binding protein